MSPQTKAGTDRRNDISPRASWYTTTFFEVVREPRSARNKANGIENVVQSRPIENVTTHWYSAGPTIFQLRSGGKAPAVFWSPNRNDQMPCQPVTSARTMPTPAC